MFVNISQFTLKVILSACLILKAKIFLCVFQLSFGGINMKALIATLSLSYLLFASCDILNPDKKKDDATKTPRMVQPDDSNLTDSVIAQLKSDAAFLAFTELIKDSVDKYNQVIIPEEKINLFYSALVHIYNAHHIPQRNQVFDVYKIKTFQNPVLNSIIVSFDSTKEWTQQWILGNRFTGNNEIDSLLVKYDIYLYTSLLNFAASLYTIDKYNTYALSTKFLQIEDILMAEPDGLAGDGSDIKVMINKNHLFFRFVFRWGDCPSGCLHQHVWEFIVFYNGQVLFNNEYGDPIPKI